MASMADHVRAMLAFQARRRRHLRLRQQPPRPGAGGGRRERLRLPGLRAGVHPAAVLRGHGPFRWAALSGDPADILRTDEAVLELFPDDAGLRRWIEMAEERVPFQGLPARICWLGYGERAKAGLAFNELVAAGEVRAPIVIGRDHLDAGSVASPNRETEAMRDGSDAIADWPLLNALVNTAAGATWVSIHHGGGVGIGYSQHAGMVVRRRRHGARGPQARARADDRPGHGRHPPRRRRLRARDRGRPRARRPHPDARRDLDRPARRPVAGAPGVASSSTGSGIVTIWRTDDRATGRNATQAADRPDPDRRVQADEVAEQPRR